MSCRLRRETLAIEPLFTVDGSRAPVTTFVPPEVVSSGDSQRDVRAAAEAEDLRARVRELESRAAVDAEQARQSGLREGEALGHERAAATVKPVLDKLGASLADLAALRSRVRADAERDLVALSLAIARRILRRELSVDPDAVHGLVRAALEKLQTRDIARVRVSPEHEAAVRRCLQNAHAGNVELVADSALQPGDVVFETSRGNLDASIETQLREIERGFADRLR
jgi:flagellar assembly protein FliH